jgi:hypothetical protein
MNNPLAHEKDIYPAFYTGKPVSCRVFSMVKSLPPKTKGWNELDKTSFQFGFNLIARAYSG